MIDRAEYNEIKDLNYRSYCLYLVDKYGDVPKNYMSKNFNRTQNISRTSEGLIIHHIMEWKANNLGNKHIAMNYPYDYQNKENLVYCDYLEHLFLHVLISEEYLWDGKYKGDEQVGVGDAINIIIPELNNVYNGVISKLDWKARCQEEVRGNKDVYVQIIKRFKNGFDKRRLDSSIVNCDFIKSGKETREDEINKESDVVEEPKEDPNKIEVSVVRGKKKFTWNILKIFNWSNPGN